jgi:excisionase family DNA binding protein
VITRRCLRDVAKRCHMVRFDKLKIRVLTVQEVSSYLRVHQSTIYRMLKNNQLPAFRVGGAWRFTIAAIDKLRAGVGSSAPASGGSVRSRPSVTIGPVTW